MFSEMALTMMTCCSLIQGSVSDVNTLHNTKVLGWRANGDGVRPNLPAHSVSCPSLPAQHLASHSVLHSRSTFLGNGL